MSNCNCVKCIITCLRHPGIFAPGQIELAAKHYGFELGDFVRRFIVFDYWTEPDDSRIWFPAPKKLIMQAHTHDGKASFSYPFNAGRGVYLNGTRCSVYEARPTECREINACASEREHPWTLRLISAWAKCQPNALLLMGAHENARQLDL